MLKTNKTTKKLSLQIKTINKKITLYKPKNHKQKSLIKSIPKQKNPITIYNKNFYIQIIKLNTPKNHQQYYTLS